MKKTKRFLALVLCLCMMLGLPALSNVFDGISFETKAEAAAGDVYLKSVERVDGNNKQLILNFSDEVSINPSLSAYVAIRLLDDMIGQNLMWDDGGKLNVDAKGGPLQWTGQLSAYEGDATKLVYTMTDNYDIDQVMGLVGESGLYKDLLPCFCIEDSTGTANNGICEGILDKNGNGVKASMPRTWADQLYMPIAEREGVRIEWAKIVSDNTIELKFSGAVSLAATQAFNAIRILDGPKTMNLVDGSGTNCQWSGDLSAHPTDNTKLIWTLHAGHNTTISNIQKKVEAGGEWEGKLLVWGIEDNQGSRYDGRVTTIVDENGNGVVATMCRPWAEQIYCPLSAVASFEGVIQVDDMTLDIQFSDEVALTQARQWTSLRLVKDINAPGPVQAEAGNPAGLNAGDWAQWSGDLAEHPTDRTKLRFTLHEGHGKTLNDLKACFGEGTSWQGYHLCWSIETYGVQGKVDAIIDRKSGESVGATYGSSIYESIAYTKPAGISLDEANIVSDTALRLKFSGAVGNDGQRTFTAIRIVDNLTGQNLQWKDGTPAQWDVNMDYPAADLSIMSVNLTGNAFNADTIPEIIALTEQGGIFEGCEVTFCMEEKYDESKGITPAGGNGYMEGYWDQALNGWSYSPNNSFLRATRTVEGQLDSIYVPLSEGFTIEEVRVYNDMYFLVEFSEAFNQSGKYYSAVRLLDANGNLVWVDGAPQQWPVVFYDYYNSTTLRGALFQQDGVTPQKYSDIVNYATTVPGVASIEYFLGEENSGYISYNGRIDDFVSASGQKLYAENIADKDHTYAPITVIENITVEKVEAIGETTFKVTFSEEVANNVYSSLGGFTALRIVNADQKLVWQNGDEITTAEAGTPLQWGGTMSPTTDKSVWIFKNTDYTLGMRTYSKISDLVADGGKYEDYELTFCIEEQVSGSNLLKMVDNITSLDGKKVLAATNLRSHGNGAYASITKAYNSDSVKLETVEAISPSQMVLTFSEDIKLVCNEEKSQPFMAFRFVDPNTGIVVFDSTGTPMQWGGYYEFYHGQQNKLLWTMYPGNTYGISNITDLLIGEGLENFASQYLFGFVIEEHPGPMTEGFEPGDGRVNNITGLDTGKGFYANLPNPGAGYDGYIAEEIIIGYDDTPVEMVRADVETDSSLIVTFSEPVTINGGFAAIRLVQDNGYLAWTGEENASTPLQWSGYFEHTEDPCKLRFVLHGSQQFGVENIEDILKYKGELKDYKQYKAMVAIEETGEVTTANGMVENVVDADGNKLDSTLTTRPGWFDGAYCDIYGKTDFTKVTIESVTAVNDLEVVVKFSEPVVFTGNPWMAIRMVDAKTGTLYWDSGEWNKGTPMQWSGAWQWNNKEHTEIRWTINGMNTYGVSNLTDLFNYAKDLEQFKDNKDLSFKFNIEELPEGGIFGNSGHIDNIRSAKDNRSRLIGTYSGGYDGIYKDIKIDYNSEDYLTYYATAINSRQLLVQFNDVVEITGNPWMSIRYVDGNNNLMWTEGQENYGAPLQFSGSWEWADDSHTAIIWTMNAQNTYLANSITDILTYKNGLAMFKGATVKFSIEELASDSFKVHSFDNLVHNITADGGERHLYAERIHGYDGSYKWINLDYDMSELALLNVESSDDSTLLLTFSEKPEFDENVDMGIAYLDDAGGYLFDERGGTMKYRGSWEYANEEGTQVKWTINKDVSIKDFISFNGEFEPYFGANVKFFIVEAHNQDMSQMYDGLICNVTGKEGAIKLSATNIAEADALYKDIETTYEVVYPEFKVQTGDMEAEVITETVYENDYAYVYIGSGVIVLLGVVLGIIIGNKNKKKGSEGK